MRKIIFINIFSHIFLCHAYIDYRSTYPQLFHNYFSQKGQDKYLHEKFFLHKKNGFFVEVGAHDGISFSNTYFFEKNLNWSGLCIEPNPTVYQTLIKNRNCACEQVAIANSYTTLPFLQCNGYMLEMYSGLMDKYDPRHIERIDNEIALFGGSKEIISVNCMPLKYLFKKYQFSHIDLLSMDIEGGEESAIKTIDFSSTTINIIVVENNFNGQSLDKIRIGLLV